MILILGSSSDSLIYVKTMLRYSSEVKEGNNLVSYLGKIYGKDVLVAETGLSSYKSELVASYYIQKYNPYIVIYLGDGMKISSNIMLGDILLGTNVIITDIDMLNKDPSTSLYTVPGFKKELVIEDTLINGFNEAATKVNVLSPKLGAVISSNTYPASKKDINFTCDQYIEANHTELVYESQIGGLMLATTFYSVPLFPILSISSDIDNKKGMLEAKTIILKNSVDIGKIVVAFIVSLSSDEKVFIRSDFGNDLNKMPAPKNGGNIK